MPSSPQPPPTLWPTLLRHTTPPDPTTMSFSKLPLEIRQMIWLLSMPDDEPEVCLLWPVVLHERYEGHFAVRATQPLLVDVGWPVAMHVCRESRATMHDQPLSGLLLRTSPAAGCPVPYRAFRPELDTLYWGGESFEATARDWGALLRTVSLMPVLASVESLALELRWGFDVPGDFARYRPLHLPRLRALSLVLADSTSAVVGGMRTGFRQPARRCKLRRISREAGSKIMLRTDTLSGRGSRGGGGGSAEVPLYPTGMDFAMRRLGIEEEDFFRRTRRELFTAMSQSSGYQLLSTPIPEPCGPEGFAQTFVEYQMDGSWKEICAERTFVELGEMVRSGPYVPYDSRPDPTQVRVNDIDGSFDVVYDSGTPEE
ncbi:hypothetical protein PWT90_05942 [Aphanocladium album]|nr:hypothetical protein PWT90_05942 [Aphanocladium album]